MTEKPEKVAYTLSATGDRLHHATAEETAERAMNNGAKDAVLYEWHLVKTHRITRSLKIEEM